MFDIVGFEKLNETEYLCERLKRVTEEVRAGRYENALDYLSMIQRKQLRRNFLSSILTCQHTIVHGVVVQAELK